MKDRSAKTFLRCAIYTRVSIDQGLGTYILALIRARVRLITIIRERAGA